MQFFNRFLATSSNSRSIFFVGILLAILCLFTRLHSGLDIDNYLWAEDGEVFFNGASKLGIQSLWTPYAGYIHLYPRAVAWLANHFPLEYIAKLYFSFWLLAFLSAISSIIYCAIKTKLNYLNIVFLLAFIILQPNDSEVFFNLTNTQWTLGLALTIAVATQQELKLSLAKFIFVVVTCLTGPFSILVAPIAILKVILQNAFSKNKIFYISIFVCAAVQVFFILHTGRVGHEPVDVSPIAWLKSYLVVLLFGASNPLVLFFGISFWCAVFYALYQRLKDPIQKDTKSELNLVLFLFMAGIIHITADFYALKVPYALLGMAKSGGGRYTLIPYTLIFFAAILLAQPLKKTNILIICSALIISFLQFNVAQRSNMYFSSFAHYANYENVLIPINPVYSKYPGNYLKSTTKPMKNLSDLTPQAVAFVHQKEFTDDKSLSLPKRFISNKPISCQNASDIAVELQLQRDAGGWVTLYWNEKQSMADNKSIRRYYPAGKIGTQFAFPYSQETNYPGNFLALLFEDLSDNVTITKAVAYCIPQHEK